mmetsp:Transcript_33737/g.95449  ORF Transcript_33737/g.95449 Transcript_33737/m.95449 type:complete len:299 (+) Transcript_33737:52-948(+)
MAWDWLAAAVALASAFLPLLGALCPLLLRWWRRGGARPSLRSRGASVQVLIHLSSSLAALDAGLLRTQVLATLLLAEVAALRLWQPALRVRRRPRVGRVKALWQDRLAVPLLAGLAALACAAFPLSGIRFGAALGQNGLEFAIDVGLVGACGDGEAACKPSSRLGIKRRSGPGELHQEAHVVWAELSQLCEGLSGLLHATGLEVHFALGLEQVDHGLVLHLLRACFCFPVGHGRANQGLRFRCRPGTPQQRQLRGDNPWRKGKAVLLHRGQELRSPLWVLWREQLAPEQQRIHGRGAP